MVIPSWIADSVVDETTFEYGGEVYPLLLVNPAFMPAIPNFVGFPPPERNFLFIANKVPVKHRLPMLAHEVIEFTKLDGRIGRCRAAAERELEYVAPADLAEYLRLRIAMFTGLIAYARTNGQDKLAAEAAGSLEFFLSIQQVD